MLYFEVWVKLFMYLFIEDFVSVIGQWIYFVCCLGNVTDYDHVNLQLAVFYLKANEFNT